MNENKELGIQLARVELFKGEMTLITATEVVLMDRKVKQIESSEELDFHVVYGVLYKGDELPPKDMTNYSALVEMDGEGLFYDYYLMDYVLLTDYDHSVKIVALVGSSNKLPLPHNEDESSLFMARDYSNLKSIEQKLQARKKDGLLRFDFEDEFLKIDSSFVENNPTGWKKFINNERVKKIKRERLLVFND